MALDYVRSVLDSDFAVVASYPENPTVPVIGTHNGSFHCDEALACALLKAGVPQFKDAIVLRTRNQADLDKCSIVVDVGGVYDAENMRFDHHQRTFVDTYDAEHTVTRLSSAGLVYKHFGGEILKGFVSRSAQSGKVSDKLFEIVRMRLYDNFVEHIDAIDNGVNVSGEGPAMYRVTTSLSSRVGHLYPQWNEELNTEIENNRFRDAVRLTGSEFFSAMKSLVEHWVPARNLVEEMVVGRFDVHSSGRIIHMKTHLPWKSHLFMLEKERGIEGEIHYVLYQDQGGMYRIQCVSVSEASFESRLPLPEEWRGVRDSDLEAVSNLPGIRFVHNAGFIGGHNTYEGVLKMAEISLQRAGK